MYIVKQDMITFKIEQKYILGEYVSTQFYDVFQHKVFALNTNN